VLINGSRAEVIGRVSMDMLCLDLRRHPKARVADTVELWGEGLPVENLAHAADTIPYTLLCGVTSRVHFRERESVD
jgi:alanine racemase